MGLYLIAFSMQALGDRAWQIGSVAAGLGFVIFVHELGHFLVAKWCGVKCEKFYVGFDVPIKIFGFQLPSKLCHFQWGETEYGVGIIPLGGYVKMLGQDDDPRAAQAEMERIRIKKDKDGATDDSEESAAAPANAETERAETIREGTAAEGMTEGQTVERSDQDDFELDPRSFPAKTVPQRMAIISAGVIMNLIFAVFFATYAFRSGVKYTPCKIGTTAAGSPAWLAGIEPGSKIIQIGENGRRSEQLRFLWDLSNGGVGLAGTDEDLPLLVRTPDGTEKWFALRAITAHGDVMSRPMLGVSPVSTTKIGGVLSQSAAANATPKRMDRGEEKPALQSGDRIVAIDGESIHDGLRITQVMSERRGDPLRLTIDPKDDENSSETIDVTVEPQPLKRIGLTIQMGPIVGVRPDSPADKAGLRVNDRIISIAGQAIDDPMLIPDLVHQHRDQTISISVGREGEQDPIQLEMSPATPTSYDWHLTSGIPMAIDALGFSYDVGTVVEKVEPASPAAQAGIQPGDTLVAVQFETLRPEPRTLVQRLLRSMSRGDREQSDRIRLDAGEHDWLFVFDLMQGISDKTFIQLTYARGGTEHVAELQPVPSDVFNPFRGIGMASHQETYEAETWREAAQLGVMQTWRDATRVGRFLKKLVTGKIPLTNVGGPLTIAAVAGAEASDGLPALLIFLTFLSANLAVVNFMPIPALDGGHFIFLMWEGISGKPVNERVQIALTLAGVGCLLCLMIFVVGLDINRLFF